MRRESLLLLSLLSLLLVLSAGPGRALAQGFIIPELGARKNGMGAAIGRPDELAAIYHNPGALALLPGTRIGVSFGAAFLNTNVRLAPWPGSDKFISDPVDAENYYPAQEPGIFAPIPFIGASTSLLSDKLVVALGVYVPNAAGASFGEDGPARYHIIDGYLISAFITAAVAYRPWPGLAVGVGASAVYIRIKRRNVFFPVINGANLSGLLGKETEMEIEGEDVKPAFSLGVQLWPDEKFSLGLLMLTRYDVSLEGPLTLRPGPGFSPLLNKPEVTENQHRTEVVSPWVFAIGANWDITSWLEFGAEFRLYLNSEVHEQRTTITNEGTLKTLLPDGFVTPKNLHDSFHTGAGFLVRPPLSLNLELMTGYHYESSASPANTVEVSAPSFDLAAYHIGARWRITERLNVSAFYSHYWYIERTVTDSITSPPTNFRGGGYNNQFTVAFEWQVGDGFGVKQ